MKLDPTKAHLAYQWKHTGPMITCAFDPKGRYVYSCSEDYTMQRWEYPSGKKTAWEAHESWIRDIAFLPDGSTVISAGSDDTISFWPTAEPEPKPIRTIQAHRGWIRCLSVSKDGKMIASGGNDNLVKIWSPEGKLMHTFKGHKLNVYSVLLHPDGKHVLSGDQGGEIHQWEIASEKLVRTFDGKVLVESKRQGVLYGGVRGMRMSPDGKHLACTGLHKATNPLGAVSEPLVLQFDWSTGKKARTHQASGIRGSGYGVYYLSDGSLMCGSGGSGGAHLIFWKADGDKPFHKFKLPNTLRGLDVHPDGLQVATAHHDRQIRITNLYAKPAGKTPAKKK